MGKNTWLFLLAAAALAALVSWSRSWWRPAATATGVRPAEESGPLPADTRLAPPADTPRTAPSQEAAPHEPPAAAPGGGESELIDRRAELEEIYVRLDDLRARYGSLSKSEYEQALADVRTAHAKELELIYDDRQARGLFDAVRVQEPGAPVEPPEVEGVSSTRVVSEPLAEGKLRVSFIVVRHEEHSALVTLEKEISWLGAQVARLEGR